MQYGWWSNQLFGGGSHYLTPWAAKNQWGCPQHALFAIGSWEDPGLAISAPALGWCPGMSALPIRGPSFVMPPAVQHGSVLKIPLFLTIFRSATGDTVHWICSVSRLRVWSSGSRPPKVAQGRKSKSRLSHNFRFEDSRVTNRCGRVKIDPK